MQDVKAMAKVKDVCDVMCFDLLCLPKSEFKFANFSHWPLVVMMCKLAGVFSYVASQFPLFLDQANRKSSLASKRRQTKKFI